MKILTTLAEIWLWMMAAFCLVVILDILLRGRLSEILLSPLVERSLKKREKAESWRVESGRVFPSTRNRK